MNKEKLKRATTLLLVAFFCWAITSKEQNGEVIGILLFIIIAGFIIFIWNKIDNEEEYKKNLELVTKKKINNFLNNVKAYGVYLESHPLGIKEIRHSNVLPFNKNELIFDTALYIKLFEKNTQQSLLITIPELAFYRNDIPFSGYKSEINDFIESNIDLNEINEERKLEILKKAINSNPSDNEFPNDLFIECQKECERLANLLKEQLQ